MEWLVGLLAIITLLIVIGFAITHFARQMREPRNRDAARNTLREDGSSAHTAVRGGETPEHLK